MSQPKTMFEKVWQAHEVVPETADTPAVIFIDLHLTHEVTSPQAFSVLRERGLKVRRPDLTLATMDHATPTRTEQVFGGAPITIESAAKQIRQLEKNCAEFGVELLGLQDERRGIVHIIGPELGVTQPGKTIVCGDSHTSTHGAFGALAFGIGTTEVGHVLATQCLLQKKAKTLAVEVAGQLATGVTPKDLILAIIGQLGVSGGTGHVIEYRGAAVRAMSMEERMTVCNMAIEAGARAGPVAGHARPLPPRRAAEPLARRVGCGSCRGRRLPACAGLLPRQDRGNARSRRGDQLGHVGLEQAHAAVGQAVAVEAGERAAGPFDDGGDQFGDDDLGVLGQGGEQIDLFEQSGGIFRRLNAFLGWQRGWQFQWCDIHWADRDWLGAQFGGLLDTDRDLHFFQREKHRDMEQD